MEVGSPLLFRRERDSGRLKDVADSIDYEFVTRDTISPHLLCSICGDPFSNPVRSRTCGHVFCISCIMNWIQKSSKGSTSTCPVDRSELTAAHLEKDRMAYNLVEELRVFCPNREKGCNWTGQKQYAHNHVQNECEEVITPCVYAQYGCAYSGKRREQFNHTGQCIFDKLKLMLRVINQQTDEIKALKTEVENLRKFREFAEPVLVKQSEKQVRHSSSAPNLSNIALSPTLSPLNQPIVLEIGNTHEMITPGNHSWTFFIRGQNATSLEGIVEKVHIQLHESFTQSNVTLSNPNSLVLHGKAYGTFDIKMQIHLCDNRVIPVVQELSFTGKLVFTTYQIIGNTCKGILRYVE